VDNIDRSIAKLIIADAEHVDKEGYVNNVLFDYIEELAQQYALYTFRMYRDINIPVSEMMTFKQWYLERERYGKE
jgi:hypothetical protein